MVRAAVPPLLFSRATEFVLWQESFNSQGTAELCKVVGLDFVFPDNAAANTYARVELQLMSAEGAPPDVKGRFTLDLPPGHLGQADFLVLKSHFCERKQHSFSIDQPCKARLTLLDFILYCDLPQT